MVDIQELINHINLRKARTEISIEELIVIAYQVEDKDCWTNADVMMNNIARCVDAMNNADEDDTPWEDEFGTGLLWQVDCHPVFKDCPPCLNDVRNVEYKEPGWDANCEECKAKWLMEKYE